MHSAVAAARSGKMQYRRIANRRVRPLECPYRNSQAQLAEWRVFFVGGDAGVVRVSPDSNQRVTGRQRTDAGLSLLAIAADRDQRIANDFYPARRLMALRIADEEAVSHATVLEIDHRTDGVRQRIIAAEREGCAKPALRSRDRFPCTQER